MIDIQKTFKTKKPVIGMIHLKPLLGYEGFSSVEDVTKSAVRNAETLEKAGFDAIFVENNYDLPHEIFVDKEVVALFTYIATKIKEVITKPLGINVLWNDFYASLSIAKSVGGDFIRVPAFVDSVITSYGKVQATPNKVIDFRKKIGAENIAILTDIHVKHSELIGTQTIQESALQAIKNGSDGLILTGKWTGDAPDLKNLKNVRAVVEEFPIYIGSGSTPENVGDLLDYADGIIVGTYIKTGKSKAKEENVNLKSYDEQVDLKKSNKFVKKAAEYTKKD